MSADCVVSGVKAGSTVVGAATAVYGAAGLAEAGGFFAVASGIVTAATAPISLPILAGAAVIGGTTAAVLSVNQKGHC